MSNGLLHESFENSFYSVELFSTLGTNDEQEDVISCSLGDMCAVLVLCDGMGGMKGGRLAAQTAIRSIQMFTEDEDWTSNPKEFLKRAMERADEEVFFLKDDAGKRLGCGCTLLIALVTGRKIYYGNVGDSRIYFYDGAELRQLSQDHTYGELLKHRLMTGKIDKEEYQKETEDAAALTGYLGLGELKESFVCTKPLLLDRNQVLCLQSDGLYKLVSEEEMKEIICNHVKCLEQVGYELLHRAETNRRLYQDNTSFILLRLK